jgi:hypothetical protein
MTITDNTDNTLIIQKQRELMLQIENAYSVVEQATGDELQKAIEELNQIIIDVAKVFPRTKNTQ